MSYLDIVILYALAQRPSHGYEIRQRLEPVLGRQTSLNPNVLYPTLRRFEQLGAVTKTVEAQGGRPARHVYRLTGEGHAILRRMLSEFPPELAADDTEFETRVSFFDLLERDERLAVLDAREEALSSRLSYLKRIRALAETATTALWGVEVLDQAIRQTRTSRQWVKRLREKA